MSDPFRDQPFPRGALLAVAALLGFTVVAVGIVRLSTLGQEPPALEQAETSRSLRFVDQGDGIVFVYDHQTDARIAILEPGTENFIRGVLRALARERRIQDESSNAPFRLNRHSDGRLTLDDPSTGRRVELRAFGQTNVAAFAQLLEAPAAGDPTLAES